MAQVPHLRGRGKKEGAHKELPSSMTFTVPALQRERNCTHMPLGAGGYETMAPTIHPGRLYNTLQGAV